MNERYLSDIETTAKILYQLSMDMDYADYKEYLNDTLNDIQNALYQLKAICENDMNSDYYRTFARCLDLITENETINDMFFEVDKE